MMIMRWFAKIFLLVALLPLGVNAAGVTFTSGNALDMDGNKITGLGSPTVDTDASNVGYVKGQVSSHQGNDSAHHSRYSDAEAVSAIKAADGSGSGLDADTVDSMHANQLIEAASDEVRIPISSTSDLIDEPGSYYLTQNLNGSIRGIDITANNVTLDLMGFTIDGGGSVSDHGISFHGYDNVTIKNGTVRGFGSNGIYQGLTTAKYGRVIDVQALNNGLYGIRVVSSNSLILRCTGGENGAYGIYAGTGSIIKENTAYKNQGLIGIAGGSGSTLTYNTVYLHQNDYGIYAGTASTLINNTVRDTQGKYGIYGGNGTILINNVAYQNTGWGIYAAYSNVLRSNMAYSNNQSRSADQGGIRIGRDSQAIDNTADSNYHTGIYLDGDNTLLRNNHATDSLAVGGISQCFYFSSVDNAAIGNTATECVTEFAGSLPPPDRYRDNIGW